MCLDVCLPAGRRPLTLERAVRITTDWAVARWMRPRPPASSASGSRRAPPHAELRRRSIDEITALPFDGYALGGLAVGESKEQMLDCVEWAAPLLRQRPRYFMGIGDPEGILEVIAAGSTCSTACSRPARRAPGRRSRGRGRLNLRNAAYRADPRPLDAGCIARRASASRAPTFDTSSRSGRCSGFGCSSLHNLRFVLDLTARARAAIERAFSAFRDRALARLAGPPEEEPCNS